MQEDDVLKSGQFPHRVVAAYASRHQAHCAAQLLLQRQGFLPQQVRVVKSGSSGLEESVHRSGKGRALAKHYALLGFGALPLGLLVAALMVTVGPPVTRTSPLLTFIVMGVLFPAVGLFAAGAIAPRGGHADDAPRWTVIAHCANAADRARANTTLGNTKQVSTAT